MSPEAAGLIGALIGAVAGVGGGLGAQLIQVRAQRKSRIGTLGAQLAAASYLVVYGAKVNATAAHEVVDLPHFREGLMAASELAIVAPKEVGSKATALANSMTSAAIASGKPQTDVEWNQLMEGIRLERNAFVVSLRESKLRLVVVAGTTALLTATISGTGN